jgi:hypothetical protein
MPERSWSSIPFRAFPSPGAVPPLGGLLPSCRYERAAQAGPRVHLRRPGTTRSTDCLTSRKVMQVRHFAYPDPRLECRLQGVTPRGESVASSRSLSASRAARCSPGFRFLSRALPPNVAADHGRSRGPVILPRAWRLQRSRPRPEGRSGHARRRAPRSLDNVGAGSRSRKRRADPHEVHLPRPHPSR